MRRGSIIDAHVHPLSPSMDKRTVKDFAALTTEFETNTDKPGALDILLQRMDKYHIDKAIGLIGISLAAAPDMNERMIQVVRNMVIDSRLL